MKIIFSPAKSMDFSNSIKDPLKINFTDKTNFLLENLKTLSLDEITKIMKIKGNTLNHVKEIYKNFENANTKKAITAYNGVSFKQLDLTNYNQEEFVFLDTHLIILSALYGVIEPSNLIKEYRLDMNMKLLEDQNLYKFWRKEINEYFKDDEFIINLASKEFSKLIEKPMLTIDFKERKGELYKSVSAYSKKGRGMMLNYIIKNNVTSIDEIKKFNLDGYSLNDKLSDKFNLIFTR
ncbi:YaaA family protein [Psychrilyobacter atlanticus]|uniref:YaaA family protein n=1 Tax=Psychrilyobacter atlanticus TaxID=271091 RepID=UPI0003F6ABF4|nr:YaaA family protein [Psychrilyobacter atlanticus]